MTYRELLYKAQRLINHDEITLGEYDEMTKPLDEEIRKAGEWMFTKTIFDKHGCTVECPSCHKKWKTYDEIRWKKENKFCPNCGLKISDIPTGSD